ncbi:hypothetical protein [Sphingomonas sp. LaA6.9]|uniref:hypothetical protein n=1 Tax=Sphingomonas sp. LaA6.9 TaxID=2919914 RepID=UPI001F501AED|nr:hypothetical protein [Sphingomonas sp. LaA6.9]MCJ8156257.1 hypothetical protein [Sphingomonas sp. LaA6.9]
MKLVFPRFDKATPSNSPAPDFAVLIAGLSAHQSASATARYQILLENSDTTKDGEAFPPVDLFAQNPCSATRGASGSFNPDVARSLSGDSGK